MNPPAPVTIAPFIWEDTMTASGKVVPFGAGRSWKGPLESAGEDLLVVNGFDLSVPLPA